VPRTKTSIRLLPDAWLLLVTTSVFRRDSPSRTTCRYSIYVQGAVRTLYEEVETTGAQEQAAGAVRRNPPPRETSFPRIARVLPLPNAPSVPRP